MSLALLQFAFSGIVVLLGIVAVGILGTLLWAGVAYWVYTDATRRGMGRAAFWAVVTFVGSVFGLLAYLFVREEA